MMDFSFKLEGSKRHQVVVKRKAAIVWRAKKDACPFLPVISRTDLIGCPSSLERETNALRLGSRTFARPGW
jgi:hypothetical protein